MSSADIAAGFSAAGAVANNLLYLSQGPLMLQMVREGSSDAYPVLPSLMLGSLMALWTGYTVWFLPTLPLFFGNAPGFVVPGVFLALLAAYSSAPARRARIACAGVACFGGAWGLAAALFLTGLPPARAADILGAVIVVLSVAFWVSPLPALRSAWIARDTSRVPLLLSLVQAGQAVLWLVAGIFLNDKFIWGCNVGNLFMALLQISLFAGITLRIRADGRAKAPAGDAPAAASAAPSAAAVELRAIAPPSP
jgi:hypothetical protein